MFMSRKFWVWLLVGMMNIAIPGQFVTAGEEITGLEFAGKGKRSGHGDNWHITWASDDNQYFALCDGLGWEDGPEYNTRVYRMKGDAFNYKPELLPNFPLMQVLHPRQYWYGFGIVAIDGVIYHFISWHPHTSPELGWNGARLVYSADQGESWKNCDGTAMKAGRELATTRPSISCEASDKTMYFLDTPNRCFSLISILQYGKGYEDNTDGYVYLYSPNGLTDETMGQTVLARVPKEQIRNKKSLEYFVSRNADGTANWSSDIKKRGVVHSFPAGWVSKDYPYSWLPFVVYNKGLGVYMMAGAGTGKDGSNLFSQKSCLTFYTAKKPWGPWKEIYKNEAWIIDGQPETRIYNPVIAPKWISKDGKSFTMIFTDGRNWGPPWDRPRKGYSLNTMRVKVLTK